MTSNLFPSDRKAPFAVVLSILPFAVCFTLLLASCTSEEGGEYDVPVGENVQDLKLEVDADGTPVLLAEVGMYYTKARLEYWENRYNLANIQTIAYTRTAGGWNTHPFRNVQREWNLKSLLVRNHKEELRAIIANRSELSLFGRNAGGWNRKSGSKASGGYNFQPLDISNAGNGYFLDGEDAWQSLIHNYATGCMEVLRKDGTSFALDTGMGIRLLSALSRPEFNMVLGLKQGHFDTSRNVPESGLFSYAWSLGAADPKPRKRRISGRHFASLLFAKVAGQDRMYGVIPPDTLAEFSLQGEELVFLRDLDLPIGQIPGSNPDPQMQPGTVSKPEPGFPYGADLMVDPTGCAHYIKPNYAASDDWGGTDRISGYSHGSTCRAGVDTLVLTAPDTVHIYLPRLTGFRFSPQGEMMVGLFQTRLLMNRNPYDAEVAPGWIYLARLKGRTWEWEKIAEFEGSAED